MKNYNIWFRVEDAQSLQVVTMLGEDEADVRSRIQAMAEAVMISDKGATNRQIMEMYEAGQAPV